MADSVKRVLLASLWHQTNVFASGRTGVEEFRIVNTIEDIGGAFPGIMDVLRCGAEQEWDVLHAVYATALSGPLVTDAVVETFWSRFREATESEEASVDGIFLLIHGAMVSESFEDVEGEILRRIRGLEGLSDVPICGVLSLYANFTETMCREADGLIAFRDESIEDVRQTVNDAALLLDGLMNTERRPVTLREHPPILWPPTLAATGREPMISLQSRARTLEHAIPDLSHINVFAGFPYSDVPDAGVCFTAITDGDLEIARSALRELNVIASSKRKLATDSYSFEEVIEIVEADPPEPLLILETSDDVVFGADGDDTKLLNSLLQNGVSDALVVLNDPEAAAVLSRAQSGSRLKLVVGGRNSLFSEPLVLEVEPVSCGDLAACRVEGVTLVLTSDRAELSNPFWLHEALDMQRYSVVIAKSSEIKNAAYFEGWRVLTMDMAGSTSWDLGTLTFERVSRPVFPLDIL